MHNFRAGTHLPSSRFKSFLWILLLGIMTSGCSSSSENTHSNAGIDAKERSFHFTYQVKIPELPKGAQSMELYMPVPVSNPFQKITDLQVISNLSYDIQSKPQYNTKILHIVVQHKMPDSVNIKMTFQVDRKAILSPKQYTQNEVSPGELQPDSLIPITGMVKKTAQKALKESSYSYPPKAFYHYIINTMQYDKSGTGWGRGDAVYACTAQKGNCTDYHSLFIGMCRASDIPARFFIGFPIPTDKKEGEIPGYHCWAKFYSKKQGWVPVDISEADQNHQKEKFFYGSLDANRVLFTSGRDIPIQTGEGQDLKLNYFVYPKVLVDGNDFKHVTTAFSFKDN